MSLSTADRLDIGELLACADNAATSRDVSTYVDLFTDLGVLDGEMGEHRGREALAEAVGSVWARESPGSVHVTLNAVIEEIADDSDHAVARSLMMVVSPGTPPTLVSVSAIVQRLERTSRGWRVAQRTVGQP